MLTPTLKPWLVGVAQTSPAGPHALLFSTTLTLKGFTRFTINESWEQPRCRCLSQQALKETRPQKKRGERWGIGDFHGFIKETRAGTAIVTCWAFSFAKGWRHIWAYNMEAFASQIMLALVKFQSKNTPKHSPPHPPVCPDLGNTSPHSHTDLGHLGNLFFSMHGRYHAVYKPDWITHPQRNWRWNTCLDTANPFGTLLMILKSPQRHWSLPFWCEWQPWSFSIVMAFSSPHCKNANLRDNHHILATLQHKTPQLEDTFTG